MANQILKIFRKSKYVLFVQLIDKAFFFVLFLAVARILSVKDYGDIVIIFSVSNILLYILQLGLPVYFQRQTAKESKVDRSNLISVVVYGVMAFLVSVFLILFLVGILYNNKHYLLIIVIHSFVFSFFFVSIFNSFLLGKGEQRLQFLSYYFVRLFSVIIILSLLFLINDILLFVTVCLVGNIIIAIIFYYYLLTKYVDKDKKNKVSFRVLKSLLVLSLPIGIASMSNFLYDKIDVILISKIINAEQVAIYNIAYGIFKSSQLLFSFILVTGFSRVSSLSERHSAVKLFLKKYSVYILLVSTAVFVSTLLLSKSIIVYVYGEKYLPSVFLLQVLSVSIIPLAFNNLTGITLNGLGMFRENLIVVLFALLINVVFNVILLTYIGVIGAVYSTLLTEVFILVFDIYYLKKKLW
ncbi:MAG: oligosaccharide flippase family protein [Ignavibacteriae bacterium]|nr:oligosaccharide flippase family protein [Ignavibacteriota bacterium]